MNRQAFDRSCRIVNAILDGTESAGLIARKSEDRLSGEQDECARADHAAGSRSSDGSGNLPRVETKVRQLKEGWAA